MAPSAGSSTNIKGPTKQHLLKLDEIKAAAARQFYTIGYSGTDLRSIASDVDLHVSSLYTYINGKEELLFLIMLDGISAITAALNKSCTSSDALENLRFAINAHIMHHIERPFLAWISQVEIRSLTGSYLERIMEMRRDYEQRWLRILADAEAAGHLAPGSDLKIMMYGVLGLGISVANWYRPEGRIEGVKIAEMLTAQILNGLLLRPGSEH
jgi:AcrR family transcriptional regulator